MQIHIFSRAMLKEISQGHIFPNVALIEVSGEMPFITYDFGNFGKRLKLIFEDVNNPADPAGMTIHQADEIATFVHSLRDDTEAIYVSCEAGISRSSAIAAAIYRFYNMDDSVIWNDWQYRPNMLCYQLVLKAFGLSPD